MARQSRSAAFLLLIAPLAEGQAWQQQILFVSFAQSEPFSLSDVNIHINVRREYCCTREFVQIPVEKSVELLNLLPPTFSKTLN